METFRDKLSDKFKEIKNQFDYMTNNTDKKKLRKNYSHSDLLARPQLPKTKHKAKDKPDLSHLLDQIGNDDLIFNNDKLITNIKIESFENNLQKNSIMSNENDRSFISKKSNKTNSTSINFRKNNRQNSKFANTLTKINDFSHISNVNTNHNSLELNCNKISFINGNNKKKQNGNGKNNKKNKSLNRNKNGCVKNVDQFINKKSDTQKINLNKNILLTPINNKSKIRAQNNKKLLKNNDFHSSQRSFIHFNNNDTISLASTSRIDVSKSYIRGKSMPSIRQSNLRLPNKSVIKNQDKIIIELQKIFGEKMQLTEDIYQRMTELDKKNCINFLLEVVKELNNMSKINKSKSDGYKQIIDSKDHEIKNYKNEIKEIKKETIKLNKIIKANNQLNKKLSQNLDNLKSQLEKEKEKNKTLQTRGKSTILKANNLYTNRYRKESSLNKNKKIRETRSQDKLKRASDFINKKKRDNIHDKKRNSVLNNKENDLSKSNINENKSLNINWKNKEENKDVIPYNINKVLSTGNEENNEVNNRTKSENLVN